MIEQVLLGHTSEQSAYLIEDYPYGRQLRCQKKIWVETKKGQGQRVVYRTQDPRNQKWNQPKASIYSVVTILVLNTENNHVEERSLSFYADGARIKEFEEKYGPALADDQYYRGAIAYLKRRLNG